MPARPGWLVVVLVGLAVALATALLSAQLHHRVLRKEAGIKPGQINDLDRWMTVVPRLVEQGAAYETDAFPNPPPALLVLYPLTRLGHARAQVVWVWAKAVMAIAIFLLGRAMVREAGVHLRPATAALILGVWLPPVVGDAQAGQTNLLMLLPLVAGPRLAQGERPAATWLPGALVALAAAIKVTPIVFLPYALFRRRWALAAAIGLGLGVWLLVVPALVFGWAQNWRWLGQWASIMIAPYVVRAEVEYLTGYSLPSVLSRLLRGGVVELPEAVVRWVVRGVLVGIGLAGAVWAGPVLPTLRSRRYVMEVGGVAVLMLWASERTWTPHYVSAVLALVAVGMILSDPLQPPGIRRRAGGVLLASAVLMAFTSEARLLLPWGLGAGVRRLLPPLWVSVLLVWVLVTARRERGTS